MLGVDKNAVLQSSCVTSSVVRAGGQCCGWPKREGHGPATHRQRLGCLPHCTSTGSGPPAVDTGAEGGANSALNARPLQLAHLSCDLEELQVRSCHRVSCAFRFRCQSESALTWTQEGVCGREHD